jgi:6-phospho-beta-glucosidase
LYHWDLPEPLAQRGGWESRETVDAYVRYADTCFRCFGDRVKMWATFNEPDIVVLMGYIMGTHPPLKQQDYRAAMQAAHHLTIAHARAVQCYHQQGHDGKIGEVINLSTIYPATDSAGDRAATAVADGMLNRWFIDPVMLGTYPADMVKLYAERGWLPEMTEEDMALLKADRLDWVGVNYYFPYHASAAAEETALAWNFTGKREQKVAFAIEGLFKMVEDEHARHTDWGWEINPEALYNILETCDLYIKGIPIYITENGIGLQEEVEDGTVDDQARIDFVREHLQVVHRAIANGIHVKGYYMWALMDNFSWLSGYKKRYGFLYVDRATLRRYRKKSSYWYQEVAEKSGF